MPLFIRSLKRCLQQDRCYSKTDVDHFWHYWESHRNWSFVFGLRLISSLCQLIPRNILRLWWRIAGLNRVEVECDRLAAVCCKHCRFHADANQTLLSICCCDGEERSVWLWTAMKCFTSTPAPTSSSFFLSQLSLFHYTLLSWSTAQNKTFNETFTQLIINNN